MNEALKEMAIKAGAPDELLEEMWFDMFCIKFAHYLIEQMETEDGV